MNSSPILSVCIPCYGRPQRTKRLLDAVLSQTCTNWEAFFIGDGCPDFQSMIDDGTMAEAAKVAHAKGCRIVFANMPTHAGGWGYAIRNKVKELATGTYFIYVDNDDLIKETHFEHYLSEIIDSECDFVFYNTYLCPTESVRHSQLKEGLIGHSEIIVRTDFLKTMPPHTESYGHDWKLIDNMMKYSAKYKKALSNETTYLIMGVGELREDTMD